MTSKIYWVLLAYLVTRVVAVVVMMWVEGWNPLEAYWWGEVASLTIGYGDYFPKTDLGRLIASPLQLFWVFYCGPAIIGHVVALVFRNFHILTHHEQEWLFRVVGVIFDWVRWLVQAVKAIAKHLGVELPPTPHSAPDGTLMACPDQAPDHDYSSN